MSAEIAIAPAAEASVQQAGSTDPENPPGDGQDALHYAGTDPLTIEGVTFLHDQIVIVPDEMARRLAGTNNLRVVAETVESWPHFIGIRARARAARG